MPETSVTFRVQARIEDVRRFLSDPQELGKCIVGVKEVRSMGCNDSIWKVEVRAGFIAQLMTLRAHIENLEQNRITFKAEGQNLQLLGQADLAEEDRGTSIHLNARVEPTGPLAGLINSVMKNTQQKLIDETVLNIRSKLESVSV